MSKLKRNAIQQNFLQYLWNDLILFRRDFVFETHLSVEEVKDNLCHVDKEINEIHESRNSPVRRSSVKRILVKFQYNSFKAKKVVGKGGTGAIADGTIFVENDMTVVEGSVKMGVGLWLPILWSTFLLWILVPAFLSVLSVEDTSLIVCYSGLLLCLGSMPFIAWLFMYSDRNYLLKIIENAAFPEKAKTSV